MIVKGFHVEIWIGLCDFYVSSWSEDQYVLNIRDDNKFIDSFFFSLSLRPIRKKYGSSSYHNLDNIKNSSISI